MSSCISLGMSPSGRVFSARNETVGSKILAKEVPELGMAIGLTMSAVETKLEVKCEPESTRCVEINVAIRLKQRLGREQWYGEATLAYSSWCKKGQGHALTAICWIVLRTAPNRDFSARTLST